jgi:hypothetical protein
MQTLRDTLAQGMADLDPDVDAIYRLTQKLGVRFDKRTSPACASNS